MDERTLERMQPEDYDRLVKLQRVAGELLDALRTIAEDAEYLDMLDIANTATKAIHKANENESYDRRTIIDGRRFD